MMGLVHLIVIIYRNITLQAHYKDRRVCTCMMCKVLVSPHLVVHREVVKEMENLKSNILQFTFESTTNVHHVKVQTLLQYE